MALPMPGAMGAPGGAMAALPGSSAGGAAPAKLPIPLPDWLAENPFFTAGFGLAGMGAVASVARRGAVALEILMRRQCLMSLEIPSKDYSYQWVMQWLVSRGVHGSKHLGVETTFAKDASGNATASFDFVPSPGRHWVRYKGTYVVIDRDRSARQVDMSTGAPWETLTMTTLAWKPHLFRELLAEAKQAALAREEGKTIIYQCYGHEWRPFGTPKRIRPFTSVIMDTGVAEEIHNDVQEFLSSQPWYLDRGIPYRRGYLLHGPPGCGKTSYVSALAGRLGYNICVLNLGDPGMTDDRLQHLLAVVPPRCIVLLEDVDFAVGSSQPADPTGPYAGVMRVSFSGLLNALDGVVATEERIVFMTTNHFKRLPRALIRPGRVDLNVYVGLATKDQLRQMFVRFYPDKEDMADQFAVVCDGEGLSMAELQGFFMFFKDRPDGASANIHPWLQARREAHRQQEQDLAESSPPKDGQPQQQQQQQQQQQEPRAEGSAKPSPPEE